MDILVRQVMASITIVVTTWEGSDLKFHGVQYTKDPSSVEDICAMSCTIAFDQRATPIQDLRSYDGPEINSHLVFTTIMMNNKARGANNSVDWQLVSYRIIGPNYLTQWCLQTEQSDSDQNDVKLLVPEISSNGFINKT